MVLLSAQGMDVAQIAKVAFTSPDRVRAVLHNFNDDGFDSLAPKYAGGRPPTFTLPERREIKKIALSRPVDHGLPFSTWSLSKLAEFLVAEGVVDDISHEGLRLVLREEGVSFQVIKTWKQSNDPDFEAKKNRVLELYDIADGKAKPKKGDPTVVICMDEFGPLNLLPRPGKQWAPSDRHGRRRAPRTAAPAPPGHLHAHQGVRHLMAAYDLNQDKIYGHIKTKKDRTTFLEFCRYLRSLYPPDVRIAIVMDNFSPHLSTKKDDRVGRLGRGQQRRAGLRADQRQLAEPDRGAVPGAALLHPRRHRPPLTRRAELDDPPLHRLAQPQRSGQNTA